MSELKVYFKIAMYPPNTFDLNTWEEDTDYDFMSNRNEKFNEYILTDDKMPYFVKWFTENNNWSSDEPSYIKKISYLENGNFVIHIHDNNINIDDITESDNDDFIWFDIFTIWPEENNLIDIDNTLYEPDINIVNITRIVCNGDEVELNEIEHKDNNFKDLDEEELDELEEELKEINSNHEELHEDNYE